MAPRKPTTSATPETSKTLANTVSKPEVVSTPTVKPAAVATPVAPAAAPVAAKPAAAAVVAVPAVVTPVVAKPAAVASVVAPAAPAAGLPKVDAPRDRKAIVALIANLRSPEAEIARDAATTLASLPADIEATDALAQVVNNTDGFYHSVVRAAAAHTLGKLAAVRAIDALIAGTRDSMDEASQESIRALGLLGDARALPALQAVVDNANGFYLEHVRKDAQLAIQRISRR